MHQNRFLLGVQPQTPLGKLTALSQTPTSKGGEGRDLALPTEKSYGAATAFLGR